MITPSIQTESTTQEQQSASPSLPSERDPTRIPLSLQNRPDQPPLPPSAASTQNASPQGDTATMANDNQGFLQIGAGLGYMRPSPLLRSERKRKQINLAANLRNHQDKVVTTVPEVVLPSPSKRRRFDEVEVLPPRSTSPSFSISPSSVSAPTSPSSPFSPLNQFPPRRERTGSPPLVKKKDIQPLDLNLQRWQKINKYVAASQYSTVTLIQFTIVEEAVAKHLLSEEMQATGTDLNIQLAIAIGAHLDGDQRGFNESWFRAREFLCDLFDVPNYEVARALFLMGGVSTFLLGEEEQGSYYLLLAQGMCESLGMMNSDVYLRLLCYSALFELRKGNLNKMIENIHAMRDALKLPYCPDSTWLAIKGNESFHFPKRSSVGLLAQNSKNAAAYARIPYLLADMLQGVASCLYCWKAGEQKELVAARLLKCMSDIMKELVDGEAATSTPGESSNPPSTGHCVGPSTYAMDLRLLVTALTADTLGQIGCQDLALQWAISFLFYSKNPAFPKLLSPAVLLSHSVLTILFETGNYLLVQSQIETLRPLLPLYAPLRGLLASVEERMRTVPSSADPGLLPSEVLNEQTCNRYTTNPIIPTTTTTTTTTNTSTPPYCVPTSTTTTTTTTTNYVVNINTGEEETAGANIGTAAAPLLTDEDEALAAIMKADDESSSSDSWVSNLDDIEDIPCDEILKGFGLEDF